MKKALATAIIIIAAIGIFLFLKKEGSLENQLSPTPTAISSPQATTRTHTINISESGFNPTELTIKRGDSVRFVNTGRRNQWPASGVHPIHQICPGLNPLEAIQPGESFSFTVNEVKECPIHDHLFPSVRGKITVQ